MNTRQTPPPNESRYARALRNLTTADGDPTNYTTPGQFHAGALRFARSVAPFIVGVVATLLLRVFLQQFFTEGEVTAGFIGALVMSLLVWGAYGVQWVQRERAKNSRKGR